MKMTPYGGLYEATPPLVSPFLPGMFCVQRDSQTSGPFFCRLFTALDRGASIFLCGYRLLTSLAFYPQYQTRDLDSVEIFDIAAGINELVPVQEITLASLASHGGGF